MPPGPVQYASGRGGRAATADLILQCRTLKETELNVDSIHKIIYSGRFAILEALCMCLARPPWGV